jgi:hypothetical protein
VDRGSAIDMPPDDETVKYGNPCPKCHAKNNVRVPGGVGPYGSGNHISTGGFWPSSAVPVSRYVCLNCGFIEEWVDKTDDLARLATRYGQWQRPPTQ